MGVYYYQNPATVTAIKVINAPADSSLGIVEGEDGFHAFTYPAVIEMAFNDVLGVQHRQANNGDWIGTESKFIGSFRINWTVWLVDLGVKSLLTHRNPFIRTAAKEYLSKQE